MKYLFILASLSISSAQLVSPSNVLVFCAECSIQHPFTYANASGAVTKIVAPIPITITGGAGLATVAVYIDGLSSNVMVGTFGNVTVSTSLNTAPLLSAVQYPTGSIGITMWPVANGVPANSGSDDLTPYRVIGTPPAPPTYNPADPTAFFMDHWALKTGFTRDADGWDYGNCNNAPGALSAKTNFPMVGAQAALSSTCTLYFPATHGTGAPLSGSFDYWSSATPPVLSVWAIYQASDTNGTQYVGLSSQGGGIGDFIGCRQIGSGDWFAVISAGGKDVATADTGVPYDSSQHRVALTNGGLTGAISCGVDGGSMATASGTIPAETGGWYFTAGVSAGAAASSFGLARYVISESGLPIK